MTTALAKVVESFRPDPVQPSVTYRPIDSRAAKVLMEAETRRAAIQLAERLVTHPMFALILSATIVEQLKRSNTIGGDIAVPLQAALFTPTFLKALADATAVGGDIARLIATFMAK